MCKKKSRKKREKEIHIQILVVALINVKWLIGVASNSEH